MSLLNHRYSAVAIGLHWAIAAGIIGMIALGWYMGDLPPEAANKIELYQLHKSIGITLLVLSIARLIWRLMNRPPEEPPMPLWQARGAAIVHVLFYVVMIGLPLTGWMLVSASERGLPTILFNAVEWPHLPVLSGLSAETKKALHPILENLHGKQAWVVIGLLVLHVGAALKHQFFDKDRLMTRMAPGLFGESDGPPEKPRGAFVAFGGAIGFAALVIALGAFAGGAGAAPPAAPASAGQAKLTPNWEVRKDASQLSVAGIYDKAPFEIAFDDWSAGIDFDFASPENSAVEVTVDMASSRVLEAANKVYVSNSVSGEDFFDVKNHPTAVFRANGVSRVDGDDQYEATGVLTLKGVDYPVRLPFTLHSDDGEAGMEATVKLHRSDMAIGMKNDPSFDWIADEFEIRVRMKATRNAGRDDDHDHDH